MRALLVLVLAHVARADFVLPALNGAEFVGEVGMPGIWFDASVLTKDSVRGLANRVPDHITAGATGDPNRRTYNSGDALDFWKDEITGTDFIPLPSDVSRGYTPKIMTEIHPKTGASLTYVEFNNSRMYAPDETLNLGLNGRTKYGKGPFAYQEGCGRDATTAPNGCTTTRKGATNSAVRLRDNNDMTLFFVLRPRSIAEYGSDFLQRFFGHYPSGQFRILDKKPSMYSNKRSFTSALEIKLDEWVIVAYRIEDFEVTGGGSALKSVEILTSNTMAFELSFIFNYMSAYMTDGRPSQNDGAAKADTLVDGDNGNGAGLCVGGVHLRADGATAAAQNGIVDDGFLGDIGEIVYYNSSLSDNAAKKVVLLLFRKWIGGEGKSEGAGYVEVGPGGVPGMLLHLAPNEQVWGQNTSIATWGSTNHQFRFKPMVDVIGYHSDPSYLDGSFTDQFPLVSAPGGHRAVRFNGNMGMYTTELQLTAYSWTLFFVIKPRGDASDMAWPTHSNTVNVDPNTCSFGGSYAAPDTTTGVNPPTRKKQPGYTATSPDQVPAYGWTRCKSQDNKNGKTGCRRHNRNIYNFDASGNNNRFFGHYSYGQFRWNNGRPSVYVSNKNVIAPVCVKLDTWGILGITFGMKAEPTLVNVTRADGTNHTEIQDKIHYSTKFLYGVEGMSTYNDTQNPWEASDDKWTRAAWHHDHGDDFLAPPTFFDPSPLGLGTQGAPPGHAFGPVDTATGLLRKGTAFFGDIAEVIVFQRSLSETEGNVVYETLHAKYFAPTPSPTPLPTESPTDSPTESPTAVPTAHIPTRAPTPKPTNSPTESPTYSPTYPTPSPTPSPTHSPTNPTPEPTYDWGKTRAPTPSPSLNISQLGTGSPTPLPTYSPTIATFSPTMLPTLRPTFEWEKYMPPPTPQPTGKPMTPWPTFDPTTPYPTPAPSESPTTETPTLMPVPTPVPTFPTRSPTPAPTILYAHKRMVGWVGLRISKSATCELVANMSVGVIRAMNANIGLDDSERTIKLEAYLPQSCQHGGGRRRLGVNDDDIVSWHWSLQLLNEQATDATSQKIARDLSIYFGASNGQNFAAAAKSLLVPGHLSATTFICAEGLAWIECPTCASQYGELQCALGTTIIPTAMPTVPTPGPTPGPTSRPTSPTRQPTSPTPVPTALTKDTLSPTLAPATDDDLYNAEADPATAEFWTVNWWILFLIGCAVVALLLVVLISIIACVVMVWIARKKQRAALRNLKADELRSNRAKKMGLGKKHKGQVKAEKIVAEAKQRRASMAVDSDGIEMKNRMFATKEGSYDDDSSDMAFGTKENSADSPFSTANPLKGMGRSKPKFELEKSTKFSSLSPMRPLFPMRMSNTEASAPTDESPKVAPVVFNQVNPLQAMREAREKAADAASKQADGDSELHLRLRTAVQKRKVRNANANVKAIAAFEETRARLDPGVAQGQPSVRDRLQQQRNLLLAKVGKSRDIAPFPTAHAPLQMLSMPAPNSAVTTAAPYRSATFDSFKAAVTDHEQQPKAAAQKGRRNSFVDFTAALEGLGDARKARSAVPEAGESLAQQRAKIMQFSRSNPMQSQSAAPRLSTLAMPDAPSAPLGRLQDIRSQMGRGGGRPAAVRLQSLVPVAPIVPAAAPKTARPRVKKGRRNSFVDFSAAMQDFGGDAFGDTPPMAPIAMQPIAPAMAPATAPEAARPRVKKGRRNSFVDFSAAMQDFGGDAFGDTPPMAPIAMSQPGIGHANPLAPPKRRR